MSTVMKYAEKNKYDLLSKFESLDEFNSHFEQAMYMHKKKFTKSEYIALNKLRKFAAEIFGVAWCKLQKAVAATHKDEMFGVSRATFDRMLRKAKKLGLITVYNQFKENKYQKHSVYVFNPIEELTPENFEIDEIVSKSNTIDELKSLKIDAPRTIILKLPRLKDNKTYSQAKNAASKDSNVIDFEENKTEYQQIQDLIHGLFNDKKITYRMYGVWMYQTNKMINKPPFTLAIQSVRALILEIKRRIANDLKPLYKPVGYFNGILSNKIDSWYEQEIAGCYDEYCTSDSIELDLESELLKRGIV